MVFTDIGLIVGVVGLTICLTIFLPARRATSVPPNAAEHDLEPLSLLFDDGFLQHATQRALNHFVLSPDFHSWEDLRDTLIDRFPELPETPGSGEVGSMTLAAKDHGSPQRIELSWRGKLCWVTFIESINNPVPVNDHEDTLDMDALRKTAHANPNPAWHINSEGDVIWQNAAFRNLRERVTSEKEPLFDTPEDHNPLRVSLAVGPDATMEHYNITRVEVDETIVCHATRIDALVAAEMAKRHFVQTLSKTFAHLPIGLAIFDRHGQLALFNPALVDLSGLSAPFLSRRPTILSFFDQMRENRQMPEPKNYKNWRQEISDLISAAADDHYQETWTLEDGRTYSVQGRPHPDGATAFLIEDISAEITLTRNFRKEIDLGHMLLDQVDEGIAVFSSSGVLTYCNANYRELWGQTPESAFADVTIYDSISIWRAGCDALPRREEIERFVMSYEDQKELSFPITLSDGRPYLCELLSIGAGSKMIRFRAALRSASAPHPPKHQHAK